MYKVPLFFFLFARIQEIAREVFHCIKIRFLLHASCLRGMSRIRDTGPFRQFAVTAGMTVFFYFVAEDGRSDDCREEKGFTHACHARITVTIADYDPQAQARGAPMGEPSSQQ